MTKEQRKQQAIKYLNALNIYKPYILRLLINISIIKPLFRIVFSDVTIIAVNDVVSCILIPVFTFRYSIPLNLRP